MPTRYFSCCLTDAEPRKPARVFTRFCLHKLRTSTYPKAKPVQVLLPSTLFFVVSNQCRTKKTRQGFHKILSAQSSHNKAKQIPFVSLVFLVSGHLVAHFFIPFREISFGIYTYTSKMYILSPISRHNS